ncbi:MAG: hypothetical protein ABI898_11720 [Sphingomonadales bacterium]
MPKIVTVAALGLMATSASASTPAAWNQMNQRVNRACIAMSGLSRPQLLAKKISFSDTIGTEVRMIRGADKRGRMQRLLCAYNRKSGRAEVQEADVWNGATTKP